MRKSILGLIVSVPFAITSVVACSSDNDDSSSAAGAGGTSGSSGSSGSHAGGRSAGAAGAEEGGSAGRIEEGGAAGTTDLGGSAGTAGASGEKGESGEGGEAGVAGTGGVIVIPPPPQPAVYTMSNAASGNQVFGFLRATDGSLTPMAAAFATSGIGTGVSLGEQGAVALDLAQQRLYAVNAGDNSFSVFPVKTDGTLGTAVVVSTAGFGATALVGPKSITFRGNTVYVLYEGNAATPSMIAGYSVTPNGQTFSASPIAGSALPLSSALQSADPAQIEFSPDGNWLVVTEKQGLATDVKNGAGAIDTFGVDSTGLATLKGSYSTGTLGTSTDYQQTPYGFQFQGNYLIVSEAGSNGVGAYTYANGVIAPVATSQFLPTDPAPCWVAVSGNRAYVANARGPSISGFFVEATGALANIGSIANGLVASTGTVDATRTVFKGPTDEVVSSDGKYLYALNAAVPSIGEFAIQTNGTLVRVGSSDYSPVLAVLPAGATGLAAR